MKKLLLVIVCVGGMFYSSQAQENTENALIAKNAIGLRLGGGDGVGAEVSYQRGLGDNNRLELDLGWRNDSHFDLFKLTGLYQWVWNIEGGFNWYVGAGGGLGSVDDNHHHLDGHHHDDGAFVFLAGDIGIEYNFDIPLLLSLDIRPEIGFNDYEVINDFAPDIALGVRYQF